MKVKKHFVFVSIRTKNKLNCGHQNKDVKNLALRAWTCDICQCHHQRDINASRNLRKEALQITAGTAGLA